MFKKCIFCMIFVMPLLCSAEEDCTVKNNSCMELKTPYGHYKFSFNTTMAVITLEVNKNKTVIVNGHINSLTLSPDVVHCDNKSITTRTCNNLNVKLVYKEGHKISSSCQSFNVIPETEDPGENTIPEAMYSSKAWKLIIIVLSSVVIMGGVALSYILWRRKREKNGQDATIADHLKYVLGCSCCGEGYFVEERKTNGLALEDNRKNIAVEQQQHLLKGTSDHAEANDRNEDTIINMDADMTTTNGNKRVVNGAFPHQGMNGNMWHDPGGGKANADMHRNGNLVNGGTLGEQSPDGHKDKGQYSPLCQRAAKQGFDETAGGEAEALVNSLGLSSESTTPPDVEKDSPS